MQRLIIRLGSQSGDPIHWLVYSEQEQEIIASGKLNDASALGSLAERATSAQVIALAPSSDVLFKQVKLPKNASRKAISAIPFMIEDELCGDVEKLFFALGPRRENTQQVAIINKEKIKQWQQAFEDAELFCTHLIPDAYCLPQNDGISLLEIEDNLLVRFADGQCMQGESQWLLPIVLEQSTKDETHLSCYSEVRELPEAEYTTFNFDHLPMQLLLKGALVSDLNLFQGEYAVKQKTNKSWDKWKLAAALAVIAIGTNLVFKTTELNNLKRERAEIRQGIAASIEQGFPNLGKVSNTKIVLAREVKALEQGGGNLSMLAMLSRLSSAFENSGVKPQTLKYDIRRSEIRMQSVAQSFEALENFRRDAQNLGFEVEQGAINNRGDEVIGVITVRG
ncbi:MAG: general secretion pathway protein L [Alphaproteobacteria bacterium]|jgi:general secretion pathway protein L